MPPEPANSASRATDSAADTDRPAEITTQPPGSAVADNPQAATPGGGVSLPVTPQRFGKIRPSRAGRWRAAVLIGIHLIIAIHIAHWYYTGRSLSPLEPSEAMQFSQRGIINAGLIFFALTILSTLVFGRWFCGWACHLVALQDGSRWLLKRCGIRPRPMRSRLLATVPISAFLYMFIAPLAYRLITGQPAAPLTTHLQTSSFWATFPSWVPAILTFLCCGGLAVYLLGSKGFCTNGCPYGAAFTAADVFAPLRIRVTDDCRQSGHCTAVCSSNVRVHADVRDFGMVVDPGCMKCLDCVSVCPTNALYYGLGRPAALAGRRRPATEKAHAHTGWPLTLVFVFLTMWLLMLLEHDFETDLATLAVAGLLTLAAGIGLWIMRPRGETVRPLARGDELIAGGAFLVALMVFRGFGGMVALLFAFGLAGIIAYLVVQFVNLLTRRELAIHNLRLKHDGRLLLAGFGFVGLMAGLLVLMGVAGAVRVRTVTTNRLERGIARLEPRWTAGTATPPELDQLAKLYEAFSFWQPRRMDERLNLGLLLTQRRQFDQAREVYDLALSVEPDNPYVQTNYGLLELQAGRPEAAIEHLQAALRSKPDLPQAYAPLGQLLFAAKRWREAIGPLTAALNDSPTDVEMALQLTRCYAELGDLPAAIDIVQTALRISPDNPRLLGVLARLRKMAAPTSQPERP